MMKCEIYDVFTSAAAPLARLMLGGAAAAHIYRGILKPGFIVSSRAAPNESGYNRYKYSALMGCRFIIINSFIASSWNHAGTTAVQAGAFSNECSIRVRKAMASITEEEFRRILDLHKEWLKGNGGERACLKGANLRDAHLSRVDLRNADLYGANLKNANLKHANLRSANVRDANLRDADLKHANLRNGEMRNADLYGAKLGNANLRNADLKHANLSEGDLKSADLSHAKLRDAKLWNANLTDADLTGVTLRRADLTSANLSGAEGLVSASDYLKDEFEFSDEGVICYKIFDFLYKPPSHWDISEGSFIEEVANPSRTTGCASGVNVGTYSWVKQSSGKNDVIWKCLIRWEDVADVVVPYSTDGKIRAGRVQLVEKL